MRGLKDEDGLGRQENASGIEQLSAVASAMKDTIIECVLTGCAEKSDTGAVKTAAHTIAVSCSQY